MVTGSVVTSFLFMYTVITSQTYYVMHTCIARVDEGFDEVSSERICTNWEKEES